MIHLQALDLVADDMDRARREFLQAFRQFIAVHPGAAKDEIAATASAMRQIVEMQIA